MKKHCKSGEKEKWIISVSGYGEFGFEGTEQEAEDMRSFKANWEGGVGRKVRANLLQCTCGHTGDRHAASFPQVCALCPCQEFAVPEGEAFL